MSQPFQSRRDATDLGLTEIESCHHEESIHSASRDNAADDETSNNSSDVALRRELTDRSRRFLRTQIDGGESFDAAISPLDFKSAAGILTKKMNAERNV